MIVKTHKSVVFLVEERCRFGVFGGISSMLPLIANYVSWFKVAAAIVLAGCWR